MIKMLAVDSKKKKAKQKQNKARDYKGGRSCLKERNSLLTSFESSVKITGYFQGLMSQDQFSISYTDLQLG